MISAPVFCPQFVGRRAELAFLVERRRDLARSRGGIVVVGGDAGIGKSRLLREFLERTGHTRGRVAVGRCRPFASAPYAPLVELLATFVPAAAPLVPALTMDAQLKAFTQAFLSAAGTHALVGIIEDLHWADSGTLAVLTLLAERLATSRILFVATYRANELGPHHPLYIPFGALQRNHSVASIALAPLGAQDERDFIDAALRTVPRHVPLELRRDVARIAEGNPFFTEELLKAVVHRETSQQLDRSLPTTVHAAILERMQPLPPGDQAILTQAAVIGRRFEANLLAHTLDVDVPAVLSVMQRARALTIVEETEHPTTFRFGHALTREAIYDRLLTAQRRPLHRRIARALETQADPNAAPDALAYHWWAAGDRAKALQYGERGGDAALAVHAYADAIACYERTLSLLDPSDRDTARVREKMATSYFRSGVMDRAVESYRAAWAFYQKPGVEQTPVDAAQADGDAPTLLRLAHSLAAAMYNDGRRHESTAFLREALERIAVCNDRHVTARARLTYAAYLADAGDSAETQAVLSSMDAHLIGADAAMTIVYWQTTCRVCALRGDVGGVRAAADRICVAAAEPGDAFARIEALAEAGISALTVGETRVARRCLARAIATCGALDLSASLGDLLIESALERVLSGAFEEARSLVGRALSLIGEGELGRHRAVLAALAVGAALDDGELLAHEPDAPFLERVFAVGLPLIYGPLAAECAQLLAARGELDAARRLVRRAMRAAGKAQPRHSSFPLVIVAAQQCEPADAEFVRAFCATTAVDGPAAEAAAELAQAILHNRFEDGDPAACLRWAQHAGTAFAAMEWPLYEALARDAAGDPAWADRIRERIGYRGTRPGHARGASNSSQAALTSRELEIARLVAGGGTNREIATGLAVSVKLVEKHLSSIYVKLALTSRSQLTAHMIARDVHGPRPN